MVKATKSACNGTTRREGLSAKTAIITGAPPKPSSNCLAKLSVRPESRISSSSSTGRPRKSSGSVPVTRT
jgi:hypothetical protein